MAIFSFLGPMLAGKGAKILMYVVVLAAIGGALFFGYRWVTGMQATLIANAEAITIYQNNEATLRAIIASKEGRILEIKAQALHAIESHEKADKAMEKSRERLRELEAKLGKYDLHKHATRKPKTLEKAMERATQKVFDEFQALANQS
jgi:ABC-type branched-subunit amino acid transport system ATPase component